MSLIYGNTKFYVKKCISRLVNIILDNAHKNRNFPSQYAGKKFRCLFFTLVTRFSLKILSHKDDKSNLER